MDCNYGAFNLTGTVEQFSVVVVAVVLLCQEVVGRCDRVDALCGVAISVGMVNWSGALGFTVAIVTVGCKYVDVVPAMCCCCWRPSVAAAVMFTVCLLLTYQECNS